MANNTVRYTPDNIKKASNKISKTKQNIMSIDSSIIGKSDGVTAQRLKSTIDALSELNTEINTMIKLAPMKLNRVADAIQNDEQRIKKQFRG